MNFCKCIYSIANYLTSKGCKKLFVSDKKW